METESKEVFGTKTIGELLTGLSEAISHKFIVLENSVQVIGGPLEVSIKRIGLSAVPRSFVSWFEITNRHDNNQYLTKWCKQVFRNV